LYGPAKHGKGEARHGMAKATQSGALRRRSKAKLCVAKATQRKA